LRSETLRRGSLRAAVAAATTTLLAVLAPGVAHAQDSDSWVINVTPVQGPSLLVPTFNVDISQAEQRLYGFVLQFPGTATMTKDEVVQWVKDHDPAGPPKSGQTCINWYGNWCLPDPDLG
jgi:hypothetical protein